MTFMLKRDMLQTRGRRKWAQIGFAVKHSAGLAAMSMGARAKREAEGWQAEHGADDHADPGLYSVESLQDRHALRRHPLVLTVLQLWWETALNSMHHYDPNAHEVSRDDYFDLCHLVFRALYADYDPGEAQACAEQDWASDCGGATTLTRERFMDSWFEMADLHTEDIRAESSAAFLHQIFLHIAAGTQPGPYIWKERGRAGYDAKLAQVGAPAIAAVKALHAAASAPPAKTAPPPTTPPPRHPPAAHRLTPSASESGLAWTRPKEQMRPRTDEPRRRLHSPSDRPMWRPTGPAEILGVDLRATWTAEPYVDGSGRPVDGRSSPSNSMTPPPSRGRSATPVSRAASPAAHEAYPYARPPRAPAVARAAAATSAAACNAAATSPLMSASHYWARGTDGQSATWPWSDGELSRPATAGGEAGGGSESYMWLYSRWRAHLRHDEQTASLNPRLGSSASLPSLKRPGPPAAAGRGRGLDPACAGRRLPSGPRQRGAALDRIRERMRFSEARPYSPYSVHRSGDGL